MNKKSIKIIFSLVFVVAFATGLTSCTYNEGPKFDLKIVSSESFKPLNGLHCELIDIRLKATDNDYVSDTARTDKDGTALLQFKFKPKSSETRKETEDSFCSNNFKLRIVDIDGSNNDGDFKTKEIQKLLCNKRLVIKMEKK